MLADVIRNQYKSILNTTNTGIAKYMMFPIAFVDGCPQITWKDEWNLEDCKYNCLNFI